MEKFEQMVSAADTFVWGSVMLWLLLGTSIFLTIRTKALAWRNLRYALRTTLSKEARQKGSGEGDVSPFSALTTALAATIGTGNIVGVATAMVSGGPGALVWMWISACFGLTSKFGECMLAMKYREVNERGEMCGGPMYTMKKGFRHKKLGSILGFLFAFFAVAASFGIGNMTQANSISSAVQETFGVPPWKVGLVVTLLALVIITGGIRTISKVSSVVVPFMAISYVAAGCMVILGNISQVPSGLVMIVSMAFSPESVTGGMLGTVTASMMNAVRYGVARGVFSNEAGMGSAAITAAAAATDHPVRQGYISMTGTFWDTIVVCTMTGIVIASSGVLGTTHITANSDYAITGNKMVLADFENNGERVFTYEVSDGMIVLIDSEQMKRTLTSYEDTEGKTEGAGAGAGVVSRGKIQGTFVDETGNVYKFYPDGTYVYEELYTGSALTIQAFQSVLGGAGGWFVCISITLFAFSTIIGWEYHGEKAFEYLLGTCKYNLFYRVIFSLAAYMGATMAMDLVWNLSDIANALMAIPNLICLLMLSGEIARDMKEFQKEIDKK